MMAISRLSKMIPNILELNNRTMNYSPNYFFTLPFSNFFTFLSIPTINLAPAIRAPIITANPTVPRPQIATVQPGSTLQLFTTAP